MLAVAHYHNAIVFLNRTKHPRPLFFSRRRRNPSEPRRAGGGRACPFLAPFILVSSKNGPFGKIFLALSRDVGTVRVHRDSEALRRCKSGTGPRPGIMSASSGSVFIIAALDHLTCQVSVAKDGAREDCRASTVRSEDMTYTFQSISAVTTYH